MPGGQTALFQGQTGPCLHLGRHRAYLCTGWGLPAPPASSKDRCREKSKLLWKANSYRQWISASSKGTVLQPTVTFASIQININTHLGQIYLSLEEKMYCKCNQAFNVMYWSRHVLLVSSCHTKHSLLKCFCGKCNMYKPYAEICVSVSIMSHKLADNQNIWKVGWRRRQQDSLC